MNSYAFYFIGAVLVVFVVGFVGYYAYRLGKAQKKIADDPPPRLGQLPLPRTVDPSDARSPGVSDWGPVSAASDVAGLGNEPPGVKTESARTAAGALSAPRVYERGPGLRGFTEEAIFMRRDKAGEVSFQIGEKPAMPLKFLFDAKARYALEQLSMRVTADFGRSWAILASEDEEGHLTVTRLF